MKWMKCEVSDILGNELPISLQTNRFDHHFISPGPNGLLVKQVFTSPWDYEDRDLLAISISSLPLPYFSNSIQTRSLVHLVVDYQQEIIRVVRCQNLKSFPSTLCQLHFPSQVLQNLFTCESIEVFVIADQDLQVLPRLDICFGLLLVNGSDVVDQVYPNEVLLAVFGQYVIENRYDSLEVLHVDLVVDQQNQSSLELLLLPYVF